jgi:hypothetical protein
VGVAGRLGQGLWINEADLVHGVPLFAGVVTLARVTLKV